MSDEMDQVQKINEQFQAGVLAEHQSGRPSGPSATHCKECGKKIPEKRRLAMPGCRRCIDCQKELEMTLANWRAV